MKIHFYIRTLSNKRTFIYADIAYDGKRLQYATGIDIDTKTWDKENKKINYRYSCATSINKDLENIKEKIEKIYTDFRLKGEIPTKEEFKAKLDNKLYRDKPQENKDFFSYFDEFLETYKPPLKSIYSYKKHKTTKVHLLNFQIYKKTKIDFKNINSDFQNDFLKYFISKLGNDRNTFTKHIRSINTFLKWCYEKGFIEKPAIPLKSSEIKQIVNTLTESELNLLETATLPEELDIVRKMFLFACYTGTRFEAMQDLINENIKDNKLRYITDKSGKYVEIPLLERTKALIDTNKKGKLFPKLTNQEANRRLKEIGELLKFERQIVTRSNKEKTTEVYYKLSEFIHFHLAKKTCISFLYKLGLRENEICQITGNSLQTITYYIHIFENEVSEKYKRLDAMNLNNKPEYTKEQQIAINLLNANVEINIIAASTGLSLLEIEALKP